MLCEVKKNLLGILCDFAQHLSFLSILDNFGMNGGWYYQTLDPNSRAKGTGGQDNLKIHWVFVHQK